ncbi:hypothetical protein [Novipirellula caenicola]|uniref:hypothetical protein n=1 Tax=Novipirellula caenicola TaxID=1536901 RepID=UPI0031E8348D
MFLPDPQKTPLALFTIAVILTTGCGSSEPPPRKAIRGQITVDGKPAPSGSISFLPARGTSGPAATSLIVDAEYQFTHSNGPFAGAHLVVISFDKAPAVASTASDTAGSDDPPSSESAEAVDPKKRSVNKSPSLRRKRAADASASEKRRWELEFVVPTDDPSVKNFALTTHE